MKKSLPPITPAALERMATLMRTHMEAIEDMLIQWSASGQIDGGVATRPVVTPGLVTPLHREPPSSFGANVIDLSKLDAVAAKASAVLKRSLQELRLAKGRAAAAQHALEEADTGGGKKKATPPPELVEAVEASQAELTQRQERVETCRAKAESTRLALAEARVEAEARAKKQALAELDARLRTVHMRVTGRHLPCRLPHMMEAARAQVTERPGTVRLAFGDVRRILLTLAIVPPAATRAIRALFALLELEERAVPREPPPPVETRPLPTGHAMMGAPPTVTASPTAAQLALANTVSLAAMRRHCGLEPSLLPREMPSGSAPSEWEQVSEGPGSPLPARKSAEGRQRPVSAAAGRGEHRTAPARPRPASGGPR